MFLFELNENQNPGQNIWNKLEKFSKIGQDKKSFIPTFACFLTAIATKVKFRKGDHPSPTNKESTLR